MKIILQWLFYMDLPKNMSRISNPKKSRSDQKIGPKNVLKRSDFWKSERYQMMGNTCR